MGTRERIAEPRRYPFQPAEEVVVPAAELRAEGEGAHPAELRRSTAFDDERRLIAQTDPRASDAKGRIRVEPGADRKHVVDDLGAEHVRLQRCKVVLVEHLGTVAVVRPPGQVRAAERVAETSARALEEGDRAVDAHVPPSGRTERAFL